MQNEAHKVNSQVKANVNEVVKYKIWNKMYLNKYIIL